MFETTSAALACYRMPMVLDTQPQKLKEALINFGGATSQTKTLADSSGSTPNPGHTTSTRIRRRTTKNGTERERAGLPEKSRQVQTRARVYGRASTISGHTPTALATRIYGRRWFTFDTSRAEFSSQERTRRFKRHNHYPRSRVSVTNSTSRRTPGRRTGRRFALGTSSWPSGTAAGRTRSRSGFPTTPRLTALLSRGSTSCWPAPRAPRAATPAAHARQVRRTKRWN